MQRQIYIYIYMYVYVNLELYTIYISTLFAYLGTSLWCNGKLTSQINYKSNEFNPL